MFFRRRGVLPGFGLSLGYTVFYLGFIVLLPLGALILKASSVGLVDLYRSATETRALSAYWLSLYTSFAGATLNGIFGLMLAWVLVRYEFPGKSIVDALVDLPFALPTAVAGIALTTVYAENGVLGSMLGRIGVRAAFTPLGIIIALTFVGIPFVVRTVQPVLEDLDDDVEEAAAILGATRLQTFLRVIFPALLPSLLTGFALALARALGEYGSVVFISGNMPRKTEIAPVLIVTKLEQYDYAGATAIASVMLGASFLLLLLVNLFSRWARRAET